MLNDQIAAVETPSLLSLGIDSGEYPVFHGTNSFRKNIVTSNFTSYPWPACVASILTASWATIRSRSPMQDIHRKIDWHGFR